MLESQPEKIIARFKLLRKTLGLNQSKFAELADIKQSQVSSVEGGKRNITPEIILKLSKAFNVNFKWLEYGEGDMFETQKPPRFEANPLHLASDPHDFDNDGSRFEEMPDGTLRMRVPIVNYKAYAGYLRGFQDPEFYEDLETISIDVFKQHRGHYIAFEIKGESMTTLDPEYFKQSIFEGSIAIGRELPKHQWQYKLHTHSYDAWVIVHKTEGILIKQIIKHNVETGHITIHSLNPDKEQYPDEVLFLDDIEQIFNVVQVVNKR